MPRASRDAEYAAFVRTHRVQLLRSACLLTAGDTHLAEDLVQTALARLYVAWPRVRARTTVLAYTRRIVVNAFLDEARRPRWRREEPVSEPADVADQTPPATWPGADPLDAVGIDGEAVRAAPDTPSRPAPDTTTGGRAPLGRPAVATATGPSTGSEPRSRL